MPVEDGDPDKGPVAAAGKTIRIACDYDDEEEWTEKFATLLEGLQSQQLAGLVVGMWSAEMSGDAPDAVVEALVAARDNLPALQATLVRDDRRAGNREKNRTISPGVCMRVCEFLVDSVRRPRFRP